MGFREDRVQGLQGLGIRGPEQRTTTLDIFVITLAGAYGSGWTSVELRGSAGGVRVPRFVRVLRTAFFSFSRLGVTTLFHQDAPKHLPEYSRIDRTCLVSLVRSPQSTVALDMIGL